MKNSLLAISLTAVLSLIGLWIHNSSTEGDSAKISNKLPVQHEPASKLKISPMERRFSKIESLISDLENFEKTELSPEERIQIARDLNNAYFDSRSELLQKKISEALTNSLYVEKDQLVARAITFSHSRLPFDSNTLPNLKYAYAHKYISFDDYYGELAHLYAGAPEGIRSDVVKEISESHNRYAVDIIAGGIVSEAHIDLSKDDILALQRFLTINEPIFNGSAGEIGYFDSIIYFNWLLANSRLQKAAGGIGVDNFLGDKLLDPATDPRATIAFLISGYAKDMDDSQRAAVQWNAIQARAREMVHLNQNSLGMQAIAKDMAK